VRVPLDSVCCRAVAFLVDISLLALRLLRLLLLLLHLLVLLQAVIGIAFATCCFGLTPLWLVLSSQLLGAAHPFKFEQGGAVIVIGNLVLPS